MSKFILFSYRRNLILPNINLGNNIISETDSTKIPGIIIDKKLNFKAHDNQICNKISKPIGLLFRFNKLGDRYIPRRFFPAVFSPLGLFPARSFPR